MGGAKTQRIHLCMSTSNGMYSPIHSVQLNLFDSSVCYYTVSKDEAIVTVPVVVNDHLEMGNMDMLTCILSVYLSLVGALSESLYMYQVKRDG